MSTRPHSAARGYGHHHRKVRAQYKVVVDAGHAYCWRPGCGKWLDPSKPWDLGHDDHDRTRYRGPECIECNRATRGSARARRDMKAVGTPPALKFFD